MIQFLRLPAVVSLLLAAGCAAPRPRLDDTRYFGDPVHHRNLTLWPILADRTGDVGEFLSLAEAQERSLAVVTEVGAAQPGDQGGSATVNTLTIENKGLLPILVCGGTLVKGGKQDRQIAQDFVIAPGAAVPVDAFCVERGRWDETREGTATALSFSAAPPLALQDVRQNAIYASSQEGVWKAVDAVNLSAGEAPATGTLFAAIEEADQEGRAVREELEEAVRGRLQALRAKGLLPVGFAYAVDGKPVTVRTFATPRLFEGQFEPFLKAMAIEADLGLRTGGASEGQAPSAPARLEEVLQMVKAINQEVETISPTAAANRNGLRKSSRGGNLNCYLPRAAEDRGAETLLVPLTQDWSRGSEPGG